MPSLGAPPSITSKSLRHWLAIGAARIAFRRVLARLFGPFRPRRRASAFRAGGSALASVLGGSTDLRPQMIGRRSERFPVRLPHYAETRLSAGLFGGGGSRTSKPRRRASAFRAGGSALASVLGGSTDLRPQMIGRRSERFPVRLPHYAETRLSAGLFGGGGSRTPVPERVPRASTGLSDLLGCRGGRSGSTRLPSRIPVVVHRLLRAGTCASLGWLRALRPLKAARPRTRRYRRLRGESEIAVVVGN